MARRFPRKPVVVERRGVELEAGTVHEGGPVSVEANAYANEAGLPAERGSRSAWKPAGAERPFRCPLRDDLRAGHHRGCCVARDGKELGRTSLRSASGPVNPRGQHRPHLHRRRAHRPGLRRDRPRGRRHLYLHATRTAWCGSRSKGRGGAPGPRQREPEDRRAVRRRRADDLRRPGVVAVVCLMGPGVITVSVSAEGCDRKQVRISVG